MSVFSEAFVHLLSVKPVSLFRPLSVAMADLAAGKKAAAIKAIDDFVKVLKLAGLAYYIDFSPSRITRSWVLAVVAL